MGADKGAGAPGQFGDAVERLLDRRVGRLSGQAGRAVSTTHAIAILALVLTLSYSAFFMTYDLVAFGGLVAINLGFSVVYVATILLARLGWQLSAALVMLSTAVLQLVASTSWVGWEAGLHLYMLLACQLVFLMFTERQRVLRWVFALLALSGFLLCQFTMPASSASVELPAVILNALLSINALLVSSTLFILAAYSHFRAERAKAEAAESAARAEYLANTDALTGLATRRPVMERLAELSGAGDEQYCVAIADLDHFKTLNDTFGHSCGDAVLEEVGARLRGSLRVTDSVGRWGGEEFIFVLPEASLPDARIMMERVRSRVGNTGIPCDGHEHAVTVSIGLTDGDYAGVPDDALRRADRALYDAKESGRDRVRVVEPPADATPVSGRHRVRRRSS